MRSSFKLVRASAMPNRAAGSMSVSVSLVDEARAVVAKLAGRWSGHGGFCRCPAHADRTPSLSVRVGGSRLLFHQMVVLAEAGAHVKSRLRSVRSIILGVLQNTLHRTMDQTRRMTMAPSTLRKDHPLSLRLPDADIAIIDRAASLRGRSRTEFMRDAAVRTAEEVIMENTVIRMSPDGFAAFVDLLDRPAKPVPEMVELLKRSAPWETKAAAE
jgi:uncharacterized protein (DUF1778 family)